MDSTNQKRINQIISNIPFYGEVDLTKFLEEYYLSTYHYHLFAETNTPNEDADKDKNGMEYALKYLIDEGFIIKRNDVTQIDKKFYQLSERGRKLKELGTWTAYESFLKVQSYNQAMEALAKDSQHWITVSIGLSTFVAAVYYFFQLYDGKTEKHPCIALLMLGVCILVPILLVGLPYLKKQK